MVYTTWSYGSRRDSDSWFHELYELKIRQRSVPLGYIAQILEFPSLQASIHPADSMVCCVFSEFLPSALEFLELGLSRVIGIQSSETVTQSRFFQPSAQNTHSWCFRLMNSRQQQQQQQQQLQQQNDYKNNYSEWAVS